MVVGGVKDSHTPTQNVSHAMVNGNRPHLLLQPLQSAEETAESRVAEAAPLPTPPPPRVWE